MSRIRRLAVASIVVVGAAVAWQQPALAACHAFEIAVSPASVAEGATVTVTVTRDAGINPSSIQVSSVDESAQAGSDYPAVQRTISFAGETRQTFTIVVTNDAVAEAAEAFRLHLSNPGGCPINSNFVIGADARVTIPANDAPPPTTAPPSTAPPTTADAPTTTREATTTTVGATTTAPARSTTTTGSTTTTEATTTTSSDEVALATSEDDDDGGGAGAAIGALVAALALGGAGLLLYRRRSAPTG
jgi:hypothetical protein